MKKIVLTGGGTAGHVMPALALVPEFKKRGIEPYFIGGNGMEKEIVPKVLSEFYSVSNVKLDRTNLLKNVKIPYLLLKGVSEATDLLKEIKPDAVFSKGGYAALPACLAAKKLHIPIIVHESDYSFGVANKLVKNFAALTITSFPETEGGTFIGNPVRKEIFCGNRYRAMQKFPVDPTKKTLLVFGGSLGAEKINSVIYKGINEFTKRYNVIHISGKSGNYTIKCSNYYQLAFTSEISDIFALADAVVSRGGANSLAELAVLNKKAVIIPLPKGNSRGDQTENALSYNKRGFFEILPQEELCVETLCSAIEKALTKKQVSAVYGNVNEKIVEKIIETVERH